MINSAIRIAYCSRYTVKKIKCVVQKYRNVHISPVIIVIARVGIPHHTRESLPHFILTMPKHQPKQARCNKC